MNRFEKICIFALGHLDALEKKGLVHSTDDAPRLTASGWAMFTELEAKGFSPTMDEIRAAISAYRVMGDEDAKGEAAL